jgi:hypothetical protein
VWLKLLSTAFSFDLEDFVLVDMAQSCCNPFDIPGHSWSSRTKNLRPVTAWMCERASQISIGSKICDTCRKKLSKEPPVVIPELDSPSSEAEEPEVYIHSPEAVASLNTCLADIGETPYSHIKARGKKYSRQKVEKITEAMKRTIISGETIDYGSEMIQQLKEKFQSTAQRSEQLQILTILPKSWSLKKFNRNLVSQTIWHENRRIL